MKFGLMPKQAGAFSDSLDQVHVGEAAGFDSCWVAEHHIQRTEEAQYWPAPLVRLSAIAAQTSTMDLVTGVLVLPLRNAVEVAEKCAVLDHISGGRLTVGVGLGYVPAEFEAYGVSPEDKSGRLVEGMQVLDQLLSSTEPVSFDGTFYSLSEWQPYPEPVQDPRPPLWMGGYGDLALKRSLRLADAWVPGFTAEIDRIADKHAKLRDFAETHAVDWEGREKPITRETVIAETSAEAHRIARDHIHQTFLEKFGGPDASHPFITPDQIADFEKLTAERFLVGSPEEIAEQIDVHRSKLDIDLICCRFHHPRMDPETVTESIQLFGDEVIPQFA